MASGWMQAGWLYVGIAFGIGLLLGSFLNVCISRLPYGESIATPASHCPACLFPIRWYDNIPLLSFMLLRGRCRKCFQRISWRYPAVELAVALWFGWWAFVLFAPAKNQFVDAPFLVPVLADAILGWLLIGLAFTDWETHLLPDALTWPGIIVGFLFTCIQAVFLPQGAGDIRLHTSMRMSSPGSMVERGNVFLTGPESLVFGRLLAIVAAALLLYLIREAYKAFRGSHGMGLGDVKLLALIAAFLGFWPAMLALFLGVIAAAIYAVTLVARGHGTRNTAMPFGTFLAGGGLVAAVAGERLIGWYAHLL